MINLSTPNEQLISEMFSEMNKVDYWHIKQGGGEKAVARQIDEYIQRRRREHRDFIGRKTEYKSPAGNRWLIFDKVARYPADLGIQVLSYKFIYYETFGSIGAFIPSWYQRRDGAPVQRSATVYTSHFFQRYCERRGIPFRSREMIQAFMLDSTSMTMQRDTDKDGRQIFVYRMPHIGYIYGVPRQGDESIIEMRTFLSTENMSPTKLRKYEELARWSDSEQHQQLGLINELNMADIGKNGYVPLPKSKLY